MSPSVPASRSRQNQAVTPSRFRMPSLFNTIRASIYGSVLLFTVICLAMAGHFQSVLAASDLTRFVPFAIFVCTASLFIIMVLLLFSLFLKERNPISTRIELASLGLAGLFWLVLGVFLTTSESQDADVECFASPTDTTPLDDSLTSFHTDQYQAMYRVLMSFALINATLVLLSCFVLLFLAMRRHRTGDKHMWYGPVTACAWFKSYANAKPSTRTKPSTRSKPSTSGILPMSTAGLQAVSTTRAGPYAHRSQAAYTEKPPRPYPKPHRSGSNAKPSRQDSKNSKSSGQTSLIGSYTSEFDNGNMVNPYTRTAQGGR